MPRIDICDMDRAWLGHLLPVISEPDILVETQLQSRSAAQHNLVKHSPPLTLQLAEKPLYLTMLIREYAVEQRERRC